MRCYATIYAACYFCPFFQGPKWPSPWASCTHQPTARRLRANLGLFATKWVTQLDLKILGKTNMRTRYSNKSTQEMRNLENPLLIGILVWSIYNPLAK